jgi:tetratricopeptide (TPR) repeat protein
MAGDIGRAARLFRNERYSEVIHLLEPQIFRFRESFDFYHMLGLSCFHTGDLSGAFSYLKRANQIKPEDNNTLLAVALIHLKRGETSEAIELWLAVQEADPGNRYARRGLNFLRNNSDPARVVDQLESTNVGRFLPSRGWFEKAIPYFVVGLLAAAVLVFGIGFAVTKLRAPSGPARDGLAQASLQSSAVLTQTTGQYRYVLTNDQIRSTFNRVRDEFSHYKDNLAQRDINRLLGSNASAVVKEKVQILEGYLRAPNFATIQDSFSYDQVATDPYLYQNCYVDWKGMVSNLKITQKQITFDFLVGYHNEQVLQGIVPVYLEFAADVRASTPFEILGQVKLDKDHIRLKGISIHQLMPGGSS